jgi:hypothetical protein
MRLTFQARQTRFHSPLALRNPRSENCLNPITDLMMPKTGSTVCLAKRVGGLARLGFQSVCLRLHRRSICLQGRRLCKALTPVRIVVLTGLCNQEFYAGLAAGIDVALTAKTRVCDQCLDVTESCLLILQSFDHRGDLLLGGLKSEVQLGVRQGSCRLIHAARGLVSFCSTCSTCSEMTESRSGLSVTAPMDCQLRVLPDQRAGLHSFAWVYNA